MQIKNPADRCALAAGLSGNSEYIYFKFRFGAYAGASPNRFLQMLTHVPS